MEETTEDRDLGPQPLDGILEDLGFSNSDLVEASTEQLTHKQVQKGRKGRRLTANLQRKIATALNAACESRQIERSVRAGDLFTYRGH
jgi:hypothetical protein